MGDGAMEACLRKQETSWVRFPVRQRTYNYRFCVFRRVEKSWRANLFKLHCKNLTKISSAIDLVERDLKTSIALEQEENIYVYTKLLSHLITCWIEVRILKLIFESTKNKTGIFTSDEVNKILKTPTLADKWKIALNIAVCKAYKIKFKNDAKFIKRKLQPTPRYRYTEILNIIDVDILNSAQLRNRIAHGQWLYAFTNDLSAFSSPLTRCLRKENIIELQQRKAIFSNISQIIHDLVVSEPTFDRDFDKLFTKIEVQKNNYNKRTYPEYKTMMVTKYKNGQIKKEENQKLNKL